MTVLTGKAFWAKLVTPDTAFDVNGVWSIDVALEGDMLARAKKIGLPIKNKSDDRGPYVTIKRKVIKSDGAPNTPPQVLDSEKKPMADTLIGNGSVVNVMFRTFEWKFQTRTGVGADLEAVQIVDLVSYSRGVDSELPVIPNGYKHGSQGSAALDDNIPF